MPSASTAAPRSIADVGRRGRGFGHRLGVRPWVCRVLRSDPQARPGRNSHPRHLDPHDREAHTALARDVADAAFRSAAAAAANIGEARNRARGL